MAGTTAPYTENCIASLLTLNELLSPFESSLFKAGGRSKTSLNLSALLLLRNQERMTNSDDVERWRNGDNSWLSRVGGNVYFRDDLADQQDLAESPSEISWW